MTNDIKPGPSEPPSTHGKPDGAVRVLSRDWKTVEEQIAAAQGDDLLALLRDYLVINSSPGNDLAPLYIARINAVLHSPKIASADDDVETCIACNIAFVEGDLIYPDQSGGCIHVSCCGPEMESYVNADGEPLKDGDPLPTPQRWTSAAAETNPGDVLAMKEACKRVASEYKPQYSMPAHEILVMVETRTAIAAAIDRLDVKAEAKSQEPDAVATFYGAECPAYPNCNGGCGLGCTHECATLPRQDNFNGDNERLIACIDATLKLDADNALVPHGLSNNSRKLLQAAAARLDVKAETSPGEALADLKKLEAIAERQKSYFATKRREFPCIEDFTDDAGKLTPPDDISPLLKGAESNGRYSEADWWLSTIRTAIDRLDIEAEAKPQEPDAVAWQYQRADGEWCDCWKPNEIELKVAAKRFRALYTHPTTKPEAPAAGTLAPKVRLLLQMLQSANGQIDASDHQNSLLNYFCDDNGRETDTFNIAIKSGFIRVTHDSHFDTSTAYLTDVGREAAIRKDEREKCAAIAEQPRFANVTRVGVFKGPEWTEETGNATLVCSHARMIASAIRNGGKQP